MRCILRMILVFVTSFIFPIVNPNCETKECLINVNKNIAEPQPLFLKSDSTSFWPVSTDGYIALCEADNIELYCTGGFQKYKKEKSILASCVNRTTFLVNEEESSLDNLACTSKVPYKAREIDIECAYNAKLYEIGFELNENRFAKTIDICHDKDAMNTLWVRTSLDASNEHYQKSIKRPTFSEGKMFGKRKLNPLYAKKNQKKVFKQLLGANYDKFFDSQKYLARGHLSPKTDHIFGSQQHASFNFLNVAPQWQPFNGGSWSAIENGVRVFVAKQVIQVECYTGTWGVLSLPNAEGEWKEMFLTYDENGNGEIAVPKLFYKVIIEIESKRGLAIIGINNLHFDKDELESENYFICDDVTESISWFKWQVDRYDKGYLYTCKVDDFIKVVKDLPESLEEVETLLE